MLIALVIEGADLIGYGDAHKRPVNQSQESRD